MINTLKVITKILEKEINMKIDYIHSQIIQQEIETYKKTVFGDLLGRKNPPDPIPEAYLEVNGSQTGKGVLIKFRNPVKGLGVEIISEENQPVDIETDETLKVLNSIGLFISKEDPMKTMLIMIPENMMEEINSINEAIYLDK